MLSITDEEALTRALSSPIDERIKRLLALRCDQLGGDITDHVHFAVVQPADTAADVEAIVGFPFISAADYGPDWLQEHGFAFEFAFDLTEDFTQVVIIPNEQGIDAELLNFCKTHASEHA